MQKISSYIYKNRVQLVSDTGGFSTEFRIVYQRTIKIYKGLDNVIEFDFKNDQQRRINIQGFAIKMAIIDELHEEVGTFEVVPIAETTGLALCTVDAISIAGVSPQMLTYSVYIENVDGSKSPVYGDTQFGMTGRIQLFGGALPEALPPVIIDTFIKMVNDYAYPTTTTTYTSEGIEINPSNDGVTKPFILLNFDINNLDADISVQISNSSVISTGTIWDTLETFSVAPSTTSVVKQYNETVNYSNNVGWLRIKFTPKNNSTGMIKRVTVNL